MSEEATAGLENSGTTQQVRIVLCNLEAQLRNGDTPRRPSMCAVICESGKCKPRGFAKRQYSKIDMEAFLIFFFSFIVKKLRLTNVFAHGRGHSSKFWATGAVDRRRVIVSGLHDLVFEIQVYHENASIILSYRV